MKFFNIRRFVFLNFYSIDLFYYLPIYFLNHRKKLSIISLFVNKAISDSGIKLVLENCLISGDLFVS